MSADLLQRLADAGTPMDLIMEVAVTLADAQAAQKLLEKRRAKDRERKAVPRNSTESAESSENPSPLKVSPQTPLPKTPNPITPLNPPKPRGKKTVSILVPEWMPAEQWLAFVAMRERMEREGRPKIIWSEDAAKGVISKITRLRSEGHCPAKLLEKAVVSSHRQVFEDESTKATVVVRTTEEQIATLEKLVPQYEGAGRQDYAAQTRCEIERLRKTTSVGNVANEFLRRVG